MDPAEGYRQVTAALNKLGVRFYVGGSVASSFHGIPRTTRDVDIVAAINPSQAKPLVGLLGPDFYADEEMIRTSIERGRSFNLIHTPTVYKFDIFPLRSDEFHQLQFSRRQPANLSAAGLPGTTSDIASAEDMILEKLVWYRTGGKVSKSQWNDILSILAVQKGKLDEAYLDRWSAFLKVEDLLALARSETP